MLDVSELTRLIQSELPDAEVFIRDLTGGGDHFEAFVISDIFREKSRLQRHQIVMKPLSELLKGPLHALTIKTYTVEDWKKESFQND